MGMIAQEGLSQGDKADLHPQYLGRNWPMGCPVYFSFGTHAMITILIAPPIARVLAANGLLKRAGWQSRFSKNPGDHP